MDDPVTADQIELNQRTPFVTDGGNQRGERGDEADAGAAGDMPPPQPSGRGPQQAQPTPQVPCSAQNGLDEPGYELDQVQYFKGEIDILKRDCQEPESYQQAVNTLLREELIFADEESRLNDEEATEVFKYIEKEDYIKRDDFVKKDVLRYAFSHEEAGRWFAEVVKNQWQVIPDLDLSTGARN